MTEAGERARMAGDSRYSFFKCQMDGGDMRRDRLKRSKCCLGRPSMRIDSRRDCVTA